MIIFSASSQKLIPVTLLRCSFNIEDNYFNLMIEIINKLCTAYAFE